MTSYDAAGTPEWTTPKTSPEIGLSAADRATVDGDGRVWVAGRGVGTDHGTSLPVATLGSFTEVGDEIVHYARSTGTSYTTGIDLSVTGIRDLRTVGDDHVAFADLKVCCRYHNNTSMYLSVYGQVFPKAPAPPDCTLEQPAIEATGASGLLLTFEQCNHREIERRPTGYRVGRRGAGTIEVVHTEGRPSHTIDMAGMGHARLVVVEVTPFNDQGDTVGPIATASTVLPFDSVGSFHIRQVVDLAGSDAIPGGTVDAIEAGEVTPAEVMEDLIEGHGAERTVAPLARIYRAYFLRDADPSGLDYWIGRRRAGWTIQRISEHFSRSSEFVRTYGALSDREFVELIYQNVLGRPSDPGGADYWSRKLARGTPRGTVMAQFSESSEFIRTSAPLVQPLVVSKLMLDRPPTADERDRWALEADPYATIPSEILGTDEYRARIAD
ncbi:MAG: DUF4214 domain-containing protein [Acidimicrobiales bacterium]|nr:DUF4214 domain-containing protein [Acidimicrobiales bacterium]